jgi:WD40 repeat protein
LPDGAVLLSGGTADNGDVVLWDVAKGIRQKRIHFGDWPVHKVAFSPTGKQFAAACDKKIKLWDHETCKEIREFPARSMAFSPDGSKLALVSATGESKPGVWNLETIPSTKLWDLAAGKEIALPTKLLLGGGICVRWSPDGKRLALGGTGQVQVIDFEKPGELTVIHGVRGEAIFFSPDSKYLYAAGRQGAAPPVTRWKLDAAPQDRIPLDSKP